MGGERPTDQSVSSSCTHQICPFDLQPLTFFMFHFLPLSSSSLSSPSSFSSPTFCPGPVSLLFLILLLPLPIPFPSNPSLAPSPFLLSPSSSPIVPLEPLSGRLYPSPLRSASASQRPVRLGIHNRPSGRDGRDASRRGALGSAAPGRARSRREGGRGCLGFLPLYFYPSFPYILSCLSLLTPSFRILLSRLLLCLKYPDRSLPSIPSLLSLLPCTLLAKISLAPLHPHPIRHLIIRSNIPLPLFFFLSLPCSAVFSSRSKHRGYHSHAVAPWHAVPLWHVEPSWHALRSLRVIEDMIMGGAQRRRARGSPSGTGLCLSCDHAVYSKHISECLGPYDLYFIYIPLYLHW